jgi:hypothetical protein
MVWQYANSLINVKADTVLNWLTQEQGGAAHRLQTWMTVSSTFLNKPIHVMLGKCLALMFSSQFWLCSLSKSDMCLALMFLGLLLDHLVSIWNFGKCCQNSFSSFAILDISIWFDFRLHMNIKIINEAIVIEATLSLYQIFELHNITCKNCLITHLFNCSSTISSFFSFSTVQLLFC